MAKYIHPFRKKWGQNFLRDPNTISKIIRCLEPNKNDEILEIGPGDGALTDQLTPQVRHIHGVEIDPFLIKQLKEKEDRHNFLKKKLFFQKKNQHQQNFFGGKKCVSFFVNCPKQFPKFQIKKPHTRRFCELFA